MAASFINDRVNLCEYRGLEVPSVRLSLRGKHVSSWFCSPVACWCFIYLALAPALSIWTQHTLIHSLMGNVGCVECFRRALQRPCLAQQEGNKGSHFTAWHEGMGTVFGPRAPVCGGTLRYTMSWAPLFLPEATGLSFISCLPEPGGLGFPCLGKLPEASIHRPRTGSGTKELCW